MAIQNSVSLTSSSGLIIPANNIILCNLRFPKPTLNRNDKGEWDGTVTREIAYDLFIYESVAKLQALNNFILGGCIELNDGWIKKMTPTEYDEILANGALAEVWLRDHIESIIGGHCTIIDPFK